jgi:hypothetical protein
MTPETAVKQAKSFRQRLDELLQEMKTHRFALMNELWSANPTDKGEVIAQHTLSQRDLESAIMRQGMTLKSIGITPEPYPESKDPNSPVVRPPADDVKL